MRLSDKDEGKHVVNKAGKKIGMVSRVEGNHAYVDPDPGITDTIKSKLGWGDADEDTRIPSTSRTSRVDGRRRDQTQPIGPFCSGR